MSLDTSADTTQRKTSAHTYHTPSPITPPEPLFATVKTAPPVNNNQADDSEESITAETPVTDIEDTPKSDTFEDPVATPISGIDTPSDHITFELADAQSELIRLTTELDAIEAQLSRIQSETTPKQPQRTTLIPHVTPQSEQPTSETKETSQTEQPTSETKETPQSEQPAQTKETPQDAPHATPPTKETPQTKQPTPTTEDTPTKPDVKPETPPKPSQQATPEPQAQQTPDTHTSAPTQTLAPYRVRGLDGLRALACIVVLFYHFIPGSVSGGFLGVDVFFVLSGFLITGLLLKEHRKYGRIDLIHFWIRRVRRLFPAVTLVVLTIVPIAHMINRDLLVSIGRQVFGVLTFSYNWMEIFAGSDYFDSQNPHLFTNVWSLGVEEQFYLIWPLIVTGLLWLFTMKRHRLAATVPFIFAILSATWMALVVERTFSSDAPQLTRAYMGTDTHAFGLMLGAALAFFLLRPLERSSRTLAPWVINLRGALGWIGFIGTIITFFIVNDSAAITYPFGILMCSLSVILFLQATVDDIAGQRGPARILMKIVDFAPFAWIGERSYGIYLWHWPLLVIFQAMMPVSSVWVGAIIVGTFSVLIAALSYRFMENPMRRHGIFATIKFWFSPHSSRLVIARRIAFPIAAALVAFPLTVAVIIDAPEETSVEQMLTSVQQVYDSDRGKVNEADTTPDAATPHPTSTNKPKKKETTKHKPTPFDIKPVDGKDVLVIGDSVTLGCQPFIEQVLPGSVVDGEVSRSILKANGLINNYKNTLGQRKYVVISLGTNSAITMEQIDSIMSDLDPSVKTVWVNAYGPSRLGWIQPTNKVLNEGAKKYKDRFLVADWYNTIKGHEDLLAPDWAHPAVEKSQKMYANLIKDTLNKWPEYEVRNKVHDLVSPHLNIDF